MQIVNMSLTKNFLFRTCFSSTSTSISIRLFSSTHKPDIHKPDMFTQLAEIPVPTGAQFTSRRGEAGPSVVQVSYSVRDHKRNVKRSMSRALVFGSPDPSLSVGKELGKEHRGFEKTILRDFEKTIVKLNMEDTPETVWQTVSPSGSKRAVLRGVKGARVVEVWREGRLEVEVDVTDEHGDFYADEFLGSLAFAPSEQALVYVAEAKASEKDDAKKDPYRKFRFDPDFGEGLIGKRKPTIFILRWSSSPSADKSVTLHGVNPVGTNLEDVRFGQAVFDPHSSNVLYATGYERSEDGRMLGIKGCFNRPTGIWRLKLPESSCATEGSDTSKSPDSPKLAMLDTEVVQKLTPPHLSCRSPRVISAAAGRSTLLWLSAATGGAHVSTSTLHSLDISSGGGAERLEDRSLLAADRPLVGFTSDHLQDLSVFPGLYPGYNLPFSPFIIPDTGTDDDSSDGWHVLFHSHWGSRTTVIQVSLKDGSVKDLTPDSDGKSFSWAVLATDGRDRVICSRSAPDVPYEIVLGRFEKGGLEWYLLDRPDLPEDVSKALESIKTRIIPIEGHGLAETIVIQSDRTESKSKIGLPPCITIPHGGPHGTTTTAFSASTTGLALEGYTLSLPNYVGSPGFGEAFVQGLLGRCGEIDVEQTISSARQLIRMGISEEGHGKQFVSGGSHGGFLAAHLIGRYPTFFSAAVLRNPVISVGEISSTDIPDWYFSEFGLPYPVYSSPRFESEAHALESQKNAYPYPYPPLMTAENFSKLHHAAPIRYVDAIQAPVLLLMGTADRRVAPSHGISFYHALKARKKKVDMLMFEGEGHPLDGVEAMKVGFEAARDWFSLVRA